MSSTSVLRTNARRRALSLVELLIVLVVLVVLGGLLVPVFTGVQERAEIAATMATMRQIEQAILGDGQSPGYFADMGELPRPCYGLPRDTPCRYGIGSAPDSTARIDHPQLRYLFVNPLSEETTPYANFGDLALNPATGIGWRGPYIQSANGRYIVDTERGFTIRYGDEVPPVSGLTQGADPALLDAWGNPIVIQEPYEEPDAQGPFGRPELVRLGTRLISAGPNGIIDTPPGIWNPTQEERGDDIVLFLFGPDPAE
ncbi:MAG: hypothetical protein EA380_06835 [Phycisphaeraceae bacterium]|nr:MAG: hypothetical protein EA380_06835 [Phycisphaeraceae bacterium]